MLERKGQDRKRGKQLPQRMFERLHLSAFVFIIKLILKMFSPKMCTMHTLHLDSSRLHIRAHTLTHSQSRKRKRKKF